MSVRLYLLSFFFAFFFFFYRSSFFSLTFSFLEITPGISTFPSLFFSVSYFLKSFFLAYILVSLNRS
ncbi:hypothetical protein EDC96DRAFT_523437, partial [Choanephora cucurbitarum]